MWPLVEKILAPIGSWWQRFWEQRTPNEIATTAAERLLDGYEKALTYTRGELIKIGEEMRELREDYTKLAMKSERCQERCLALQRELEALKSRGG